MSLSVSPELLTKAERGQVTDAEFIDCIRTSLPYAWDMMRALVVRMEAEGTGFADNRIPPPDEEARGQLLRALASDAIRGALQRHFGVRLAFQNCHRLAVFAPVPVPGERYALFTSAEQQLLNQTPELRDC
ncbi:SCO5389 family protein [Streptomyces hokutonensis]|uniref:SCO5389 family protein n=1 Tax=Streptomyces hokutonensis TaxID=1306990 RepID=UPI00035DE5B8|nr:SCO5389 family protein [Streptomyces hokutonensis]